MPRIYVLAGVNGAGKSSIGGAAVRSFGGDYYNPDEAARSLMDAGPGLDQTEANSQAWLLGKSLLERAIDERLDFAIETTLGANTLPALLAEAASQGMAIHVWYAGLSSPELHIERVRARVRKGGHDIPEADIRRRYEHSRLNLIQLMPDLAALRLFDNSAEADPSRGMAPAPRMVLDVARRRILGPADLSLTPEWAKPIVTAALKLPSPRS
ncbi:MAG: ZTL protein [Betaproteobacteria bacterium]|nr:ZTL protein [Betaproteobacteria bacterium]